MKPGARTRQHRFRAIHIAGAILFVGAAFLLRLASQGLPQRWVDALADAASTDRFALELEGVSVSLLRTELDGGDVLPGFRITVREVFADLEG